MTIATAALGEALNWRYATKKFDPSKRIAAETWAALENALMQAPSSFGLQPWRFYVVDNTATRTTLRAASWNQAQITDASHLVVLARRSPLSVADVSAMMARTSEVRGIPLAELAGYQSMIEGFLARPGFDSDLWAARQVYVALGVFLTSAALLGVDACPMEGFDPAAYDQTLQLAADGYRSTVVVTAGYRQSDDSYAALKKVRFPRERLIVHR